MTSVLSMCLFHHYMECSKTGAWILMVNAGFLAPRWWLIRGFHHGLHGTNQELCMLSISLVLIFLIHEKLLWLSGLSSVEFDNLFCIFLTKRLVMYHSVFHVMSALWRVPCEMSCSWYLKLNELQVKYDDGEAEDLTLANERIQFSISSEEMKCLNLKFGTSNLDKKGYDELLALAVSFHDYQGLDPDDLLWAKIIGTHMSFPYECWCF